MTPKHAQFAATSALTSESAQGSLVSKTLGVVMGAWQRVKDERAIQRAIIELNELEDRALRDIGIGRSEIEAFARFGRKTHKR